MVISAGLTDAGCVRAVNQDRILVDDELGLYVVCDGIGGRRRGDVAAELATNAIRQYVATSKDPRDVTWPYGYNMEISYSGNRLLTAAKLASRQVWRRSEESLDYLGMGTTIGAVLVDGRAAAITNVGDTRIYLFRVGQLQQISIDDTAGSAGGGKQPVGPANPMPAIRSILIRAAGSQENTDMHLAECSLEHEDQLLISSDGLHGYVNDEEISTILAREANPADAAASLLNAAKAVGAPDNVSAVILKYV